jgi:hypothetical protein
MEKSPTFADFNPANNPDVDIIKSRTDEIIAIVKRVGNSTEPEIKRRAALAATYYEIGAMFAVKALFS